jgi:spoIIIJ-associated protein
MDKDYIKNIIEEIFKHTACTLTSCEFTDEGSMLWCSISTPDSRFLIGREGETLRSFNHIVRKMIEKKVSEDEAGMLMIDINGYNKKRFDSLKATAHMLAERARYFKNSVELEPMPAYERRIVHMFLENIPDIITESSGVGPGRRVVIKYKEKEEI